MALAEPVAHDAFSIWVALASQCVTPTVTIGLDHAVGQQLVGQAGDLVLVQIALDQKPPGRCYGQILGDAQFRRRSGYLMSG